MGGCLVEGREILRDSEWNERKKAINDEKWRRREKIRSTWLTWR